MNVNAQTIELYAKQLRTPAFNHYGDIIRQLGPDQGYEDFLIALMKMELDSRMERSQRRKIKAATFPYIKTIDELDFSRECKSFCVNGIIHHLLGNTKSALLHVEDRAPVETDPSAT
jgi:DNA replication protein DnaC